jgi:hypothetical protein
MEVVRWRLIAWPGVRAEAHRVDEPDAGQDGRSAPEQVTVRACGLADHLQAVPVCHERGQVAVSPLTRNRAGVEEVEFEIVDPRPRKGGEHGAQVTFCAGVSHVNKDRLFCLPVPSRGGPAEQPFRVPAIGV